jgi:hypothetical protein
MFELCFKNSFSKVKFIFLLKSWRTGIVYAVNIM